MKNLNIVKVREDNGSVKLARKEAQPKKKFELVSQYKKDLVKNS